MTKLIILVSLLISGAALWYLFERIEERAPAVTTTPPASTVMLLHAFKDGVHRFDGEIRVPPCSRLSTTSFLDHKATPTLVLLLTTETEPLDSANCVQFSGIIPFEIVTDAPQGVHTVLRVNGTDVPFVLTETFWQDPRGTILNLENRPR